ncbi:MAG: PDZ domain-containing protein [Actinophytocola sp.]|uniref:S1C family serine protease n=1 Tax=Actinophytocola sp. TaxID=1872138 RepID=UPI0013233635|nr:trypsin-like peptidase domain-containing protein [Actinophytocola sp.]MPZ84660.1 PDZ domain-containing protein [Actinophytocola sp.]
MNDQVTPESNGAERPRLGPRPLHRPQVDPSSAAVFGRPAGVDGAFSPPPGGAPAARSVFGEMKVAPPAPESLASAFGRPPGATEVLQRPPSDDAPNGVDPWDDEAAGDPWRDPAAGAVIGPPALGAEDAKLDDGKTAKSRPAGQLLSLPELIFGRRVKVTALLTLALVALLVGGAGGVAGWFLARSGDSLHSDVTLAEVTPGKERPAGSVADIARRVRPAVVSIEVKVEQGGGFGSGAVIDSSGYILTNEHVVTLGGAAEEGQQITAVFNDGTRVKAALVGTDPKTDLAVIKVDVPNPTVLQLGSSSDLEVGDSVIAIGSPLGLTDTVTQGIVSALHRPVAAGEEDGEPAIYDAIQTDAPINRGNSGGPLVDSTGALVGVNSAIATTDANSGSVGLGYAIPIDDARAIAEALIRDGKVNHADLGVNAASVSADTADGARVQNVKDGGAAGKAGIEQGDVITKVGDRDVANAAELIIAVRKHKAGETVAVVLARDGRELTVQVTLQSD